MRSPITESNNAVLEKEISSSFFVNGYKKELGIDVSKFFPNIPKVGLYKCLDTGYRFFAPFGIAGDDDFYRQLEKFPWYYMAEKWEHKKASEFLKKGDKLLEIGCAHGAFLESQVKREIVAEGLEMNSSALADCKKKGLVVSSERIETFSKQKPLYYDVVASFQVLEHVPEVKSFINASLGVLKPGGLMIVSVPNNDSITLRDENLLDMPPHHMGLWTMNSLITLQKYFPMTIESIYVEPLQEYHLAYATRKANKKVSEKIKNKAGIFSPMFQKFASLVTYVGIEEISNYINGHTVLAVFRKNI